MTAERIRLATGTMAAEIGAQGGVVLALSQGGIPLLRRTPLGQEADPLAAACFPLVPFGGRVRGNGFSCGGKRYTLSPNSSDPLALHGSGWLSRWAMEERDAAGVTLVLRGEAAPYRFTATQRFALHDDNLVVAMDVRNDGAVALPFGLGLHPYIPWPPGTTLRAVASGCWPEAEGYLPGPLGAVPPALDFSTPREPPRAWTNAGFSGWDGRAEVTFPAMQLSIEADAVFAQFHLFVSDPAFEPGYAHRHFCFEPMTHAPDGHNQPGFGGLVMLATGESMHGSVTFRARPAETRH